jgi:hypothetical protein
MAMRLGEVLREAVRMQDYETAAKIADVLRHRYGMNYAQIQALAERLCSEATPERWETLMYESEINLG